MEKISNKLQNYFKIQNSYVKIKIYFKIINKILMQFYQIYKLIKMNYIKKFKIWIFKIILD